MMIRTHKLPLDLDLYETYKIPQEYSAFKIVFENIDAEKAEDLEYEYLSQGHSLFHSELERSKQDLFKLTLIVAKLDRIQNK